MYYFLVAYREYLCDLACDLIYPCIHSLRKVRLFIEIMVTRSIFHSTCITSIYGGLLGTNKQTNRQNKHSQKNTKTSRLLVHVTFKYEVKLIKSI